MPNPLLLADMSLTNGEILGLATLAFGGMATAMGLVFRMLIQALKEDRDSWRQMAKAGNDALEKAAGSYQKNAPMAKKVPPLAKVVPEHSSEPTAKAIGTAELQTERARQVAATLALGLESRSEVEAKEKQINSAIGAAADVSQVAADKIGELKKKSEGKP